MKRDSWLKRTLSKHIKTSDSPRNSSTESSVYSPIDSPTGSPTFELPIVDPNECDKKTFVKITILQHQYETYIKQLLYENISMRADMKKILERFTDCVMNYSNTSEDSDSEYNSSEYNSSDYSNDSSDSSDSSGKF